MVRCVKFNRDLPGLDHPPVPGEMGEKIHESVSIQAWEMWKDHVVILINHYGLNMADPRAHEFIYAQLEEFFFGEGAQLPDDWVAEGQGGKGGPPAKGAPAPPRK
jgi:Fe-S cluster biosynthesis and repair protein YggX